MCGPKYAQPFKGGPDYASLPSTLRQYDLSSKFVSKYPYMAMPNVQKNAMNGYNFQQNKPIQQYQPQTQVNDAVNPIYLKPAKQYSFAPQGNYGLMRKAPLPITESQHDLAAVIANELGIITARKKKVLIESAS